MCESSGEYDNTWRRYECAGGCDGGECNPFGAKTDTPCPPSFSAVKVRTCGSSGIVECRDTWRVIEVCSERPRPNFEFWLCASDANGHNARCETWEP